MGEETALASAPENTEPLFDVGGAIRYLRERAGLSARGLSLGSSLSVAYVQKLEAGKLDPSLRCFAAIARALQMSPWEVYVVVMSHGLPASAAMRGAPGADGDCHTPLVQSAG